MKYLMLVCVDESVELTPEDLATIATTTERWVDEMDGRGVRLDGSRLQPVGQARAVRIRGGEVSVSDGPFAETKEQIAGFDILDCKDLDEAVEVAAKHSMAPYGTIEVRPFWQP